MINKKEHRDIKPVESLIGECKRCGMDRAWIYQYTQHSPARSGDRRGIDAQDISGTRCISSWKEFNQARI